MIRNLNLAMVLIMAWVLVGGGSAYGNLSWNFDDGTLQGWTKRLPFNGDLFVESGHMVATDSMAGGGGLLAKAPGVAGDLSGFLEMSYRQFIYNNPTAVGTAIRIEGTDGTIYSTPNWAEKIGAWSDRSVRFDDPAQWTLQKGSSSFEAVLQSAAALYISMDASQWSGGRESAVDDITIKIIPVPSSFLLVIIGLGLAKMKKRKFS